MGEAAVFPGGGDKTFKLADTILDQQDITIDYQAPVYNYVEHYTIPMGAQTPRAGFRMSRFRTRLHSTSTR